MSDATTTSLLFQPKPKLAPIASCETLTDYCDVNAAVSSAESSSPRDTVSDDSCWASPAFITIISSNNVQQQNRSTTTNSRRLQLPTTLDSLCALSTDEQRTAASSDTLVPCSPGHCAVSGSNQTSTAVTQTATTPTHASSGLKRSLAALLLVNFRGGGESGRKSPSSHQLNALALSPATSPKLSQSPLSAVRRLTSHDATTLSGADVSATSTSPLHRSPICSPKLQRASSPISYSHSSPNIITNLAKSRAASTSVSLLSLNLLGLMQ